MSDGPETVSDRIEMFPIGYVENDYLEPVYDEEIYRKVSKIVLKKELAEGLYHIDDFRKVYVLFFSAKQEDMNLSSTAVTTGSSREFSPAEAHTGQME